MTAISTMERLDIKPEKAGEFEPLNWLIYVDGVKVASLVRVPNDFGFISEWDVKPFAEVIYADYLSIRIRQSAPHQFDVAGSSYWYPTTLREAVEWVLDNFTAATQPLLIAELDRADKARKHAADLKIFEGKLACIPNYKNFFINQAEREGTLLTTMIDYDNLAYQALYEYEMPRGTTALTFDEYGKSPMFQKTRPGYNTMSTAWLKLLVAEDENWVGNSQQCFKVLSPAEQLELRSRKLAKVQR